MPRLQDDQFKKAKLNVALYTGSGTILAEKIIDNDFNLAALSERNPQFLRQSPLKKYLEKLYWRFIKRKPLPYVSELASDKGIPYFVNTDNNNSAYAHWLKANQIDILITHLAPILPPEVFKAPKLGTLNIHPSLLPKYRGSNPYFWMYYNFDMTAGVTLHFIDENIDTGDIVDQQSFNIQLGQPATEVSKKLIHHCAVAMLVDALTRLENGEKLSTRQQPAGSPTPYAGKISNEKYRSLMKFDEWSLQQFWHVLHANEQWRNVFIPATSSFSQYDWSLDYFDSGDFPGDVGTLCKNDAGFYIKHPRGGVFLKRTRSLNKRLRALL